MANVFDTIPEEFTTSPESIRQGPGPEERTKSIEEFRKAEFPTLGEQALQEAPTIGGIVGGLLGSFVTPGLGTLTGRAAGGALGSALGGMVGVGAQQVAEPQPTGEFMKRLGVEGVTQGLLDVGGGLAQRGLGMAGRGVGKLLGNKVNPEAEIAQRVLQKQGATLTKGQALEAGPTRAIEGIISNILTAKPVFSKAMKNVNEALDREATDLVLKTGGNPDRYTAGLAFQDAITKGNVELDNVVGPMYSALDKIAYSLNTKVDFTGVKKLAQAQLEKQQAGQALKGKQKELLEGILSLPDNPTFTQLQTQRSYLVKTARDLGTVGQKDTMGEGTAKRFSEEVEKAMENSALKANNLIVYQLYRTANNLYREGTKDLSGKSNFIAKLVADQPENVGAQIAATGNVSQILEAKKALARAASLDKSIKYQDRLADLQAGFIEGMLSKRGPLDADKLIQALEKREVQDTMKTLLTTEQQTAFKEFVTASKLGQQSVPSLLPIAGSMLQAGAVGGATMGVTMGNPYGLLTLIAGGAMGRALAKTLTNPRAVNALIVGSRQIGSGLGKSGPIIAKVTKTLVDEGVIEKETPEKKQNLYENVSQ